MNCCVSNLTPPSEAGLLCSGGFPWEAMEYWKENGLVTGGEFGSHGTCDPYPIPPRYLQNATSLKEHIYNKTNKACKEELAHTLSSPITSLTSRYTF